MANTYNFSQSCELLQTNPKTFKAWLAQASIDATKQIDLADPRQKLITKAQLQLLAERHGRVLPPLDEEAEPASSDEQIQAQLTRVADRIEEVIGLYATLHEQVATLQHDVAVRRVENSEHEQHTRTRLDEIGALIEQLLTRLQDIPSQQSIPLAPFADRDTSDMGHQNGQALGAEQEAVSAQVSSEPTPASTSIQGQTSAPIPAKVPAKTTRSTSAGKKSSSKKKPAGKKKLPVGLLLLRDVAGQHTIDMDRASAAGKSGKIAVIRGKWLVNSRWAYDALDAQGLYDFYQVFHQRNGFTRCDACPHDVREEERYLSEPS